MREHLLSEIIKHIALVFFAVFTTKQAVLPCRFVKDNSCIVTSCHIVKSILLGIFKHQREFRISVAVNAGIGSFP